MIKSARSQGREDLPFDEPLNGAFLLTSGLLLTAILGTRLLTLIA